MTKLAGAAARLFAGDAAARGLAFATVLFAARLLGPESFGQFSLAYSAGAVAFLVTDLGVTPVLLRRLSGSTDSRVMVVAYLVNLTSALILYGLLVGVLLLADRGVASVAAIYGIIIPINALESSIEAFLLAAGRAPRVGLIRLAGNAVLVVITPILLLQSRSAAALAIGFVLANAVKLVGGAVSIRGQVAIERPPRAMIWGLLAESWPFFGAALASFLYFRVDVFLVQAIAGGRALGIYAAGYRFIDAAILLPGAIAYVLFPGWARNTSDLRGAASVARLVAMLGVILAVGGAVGGPWLVSSILGSAYAESGTVLRILSVGLPVLYVDVLLVWVAYALRRERAVILVGSVALVVNLGVNIALIPTWGGRGAAVATVISEVANLAGYAILLRHELRGKWGVVARFGSLLSAGLAVAIGAGFTLERIGVEPAVSLVLAWIALALILVGTRVVHLGHLRQLLVRGWRERGATASS